MLQTEKTFNIAELSEEIYKVKEYLHLLEGFTYAQATELWFAAKNEQ
jgi:hypothetical protein